MQSSQRRWLGNGPAAGSIGASGALVSHPAKVGPAGLMAGQLTFDPSGLAMLSTSYGQTAAAQRSQDLAQALAAMRDPAVGVGAPDDPLGDRLAEALIQRKYGPSAQDFAQAAQSAYSGLDQPSGGPLAPFAPATTPDSLWLPSGRGAAAPTIDEPIPAPDAGVPQGGDVTFHDLIPNLDLNVPQNQNVPSLGRAAGSAQGAQVTASPATPTGAAAASSLDGITTSPDGPPGMMFARYLVQPEEAGDGDTVGSAAFASSEPAGMVSPLLPKGVTVLNAQLDTSPSAQAAMTEPVYRYDHTFTSLTDVHPDRTVSSIDAPGGSMHVWNTTGHDIATLDSLGYDASTQSGFVDRAYYDAYTGDYLGSRKVVNDGVPFQLPNGTVVEYDPAPGFLDKLSSAWSDSWLGQAARETWDDMAGGALGTEGQLLGSAATVASGLPTAVRLLLTGGAEGRGLLRVPWALRAGQLAEGDQLAALGATGKIYPEGSFSVSHWDGYPTDLPKPEGPFRLVDSGEYTAARRAANQANRAMRAADPTLDGLQIHEIHPVKFGDDPADPLNKIPLTQAEHTRATTWWNRLQHDLTKY